MKKRVTGTTSQRGLLKVVTIATIGAILMGESAMG
jgi:hypothetical protein